VTIDGETYEFSTENAAIAQCLPDLFGTMAVGIPLADGGDGLLNIVALHEGTDPAVVEVNNKVQVDIGDTTWVADPDDVRIAGNPDHEGLSQVDSVEVNASTVTGTATFVNTSNFNEVESATGTFEATCGEERLSSH
jgi:glycerate kinase